ncbi:MAG: MFS transporter [Acidobacteriota bacterium]
MGGRSSPFRNRTVLGFSLASFFSDSSHEMATAVLPLYLQQLGLGASVLGWVEGLSDVFASAAKYWAGVAGQRMERRKGWVALGYLVTTLCVGAFAFAASALPFVLLRTLAWIGRGFRGPLRDALMAEAVEPSAYGKAYGLERAGDMAGAVAGPLLAALFLGLSLHLPAIFLITTIPGVLAVLSVVVLVGERPPQGPLRQRPARPSLPPAYWLFLGAVLLFGLGDFSRTFLILEAARRLPPGGGLLLSVPVLLYVFHNAVSGLATFPAGALTDRASPGFTLLLGYGLGVLFNLGMAFLPGTLWLLPPLFLLSGVYIAVEETVEKATAARMIGEEARTYALGLLATANAVGDLASSVLTGWLLDHVGRAWAYGTAAAFTLAGFLAMGAFVLLAKRGR